MHHENIITNKYISNTTLKYLNYDIEIIQLDIITDSMQYEYPKQLQLVNSIQVTERTNIHLELYFYDCQSNYQTKSEVKK